MSKKTRYFMVVSGAVLAVGLGTGMVASYIGLPIAVFSSAAGPDELQYVPADAAVVAYADVKDVLNSEFRQRFRQLEPQSTERNEFEQRTGINFEQDIDSVVAAMMPNARGLTDHPQESALLLARGRFDASRLEALAVQHGGVVADYAGKRIVTHRDADDPNADRDELALAFIDADLVAIGNADSVRKAIDARRENRNVVSNTEMMRLVAEMDSSNAWAVGRFDALANGARIPTEVKAQIPTISWFSAAGHINGGVSGVLKAETKDEAAAQNLRDVIRGFLALAKMQAGSKPGMKEMVDSLQLSGEGKTVSLAFTVPTELLDVLEAMGKARVTGVRH
ncbi:MAG: DUF3352 domain-containing protein [Vicinamibacterales bacterium]